MKGRDCENMLAKLFLLATVIIGAPLAWAQEAAAVGDVAVAAERRLQESLDQLAALRAAIQEERLPLAERLSSAEAELLGLRRRLVEKKRGQNVRALEDAKSAQALKLRRDEIAYVSSLLDEYVRGFPTTLHVGEAPRYAAVLEAAGLAPQNEDLSEGERLGRQVELVRTSLGRVEEMLGGTRFDGQAVDPQGSMRDGRFALVGPVALFASNGGGPAGLAIAQAGSERTAVRPLDEKLAPGLVGVVEDGEGLLPFDPTRGGALSEFLARASLIHFFKKGGPIMWPLLFVSVLAVTVILERLWFLARVRRHRDHDTLDTLFECVGTGRIEDAVRAGRGSRDYIARALTYALEHRKRAFTNALMRSTNQELVRFTRGISVLDTCVTLAPLLGLLGTVTGMMGSFGMLGGSELSAPAQITGGIAEALIATAFGLGIAVTAMIPMNYLHNQNEQARHTMEDAATHLELLIKPYLDGSLTEGAPQRPHAATA